ncbi:EAL domain-containing protein [Alteromonadaceae bacterium BrNp21-10]|nr:EAL domain-containing protein [Alteromonadaceae bacterium BrNp21-10]
MRFKLFIKRRGVITYLLVLFCSLMLQAPATATISDIQFENFTTANGLSQNSVIDIVEDNQGFLWIATEGGLNRFDGYEFKNYSARASTAEGITNQLIHQLYIDKRGTLWVASNEGLYRYNRAKDSFIRFNQNNSQLKSNNISYITEDINGNLLVAVHAGLFEFVENQNKFSELSFSGPAIIPKNITVMHAEQNRIWIGSHGEGIFVLDKATNKLWALEDADNPWGINITARYLFDFKIFNEQYWLATELGVLVLDKFGTVVNQYNTETKPALVYDIVRTIEMDHRGDVWFGTESGITILNIQKQTSFSINQDVQELISLKNDHILKIYLDSSQTIWIGTLTGGMHKYNQHSAAVKHYRSQNDTTISLSDNVIWAIDESNDGNIWIATQSGGLNLFDKTNITFTHFLNELDSNIWDLAIDADNKIWIATDKGILVYVYQQNTLELVNSFFPEMLVPNINLYAGQVWTGGKGEIVGIDTNTFEETTLSLGDAKITSGFPLLADSNHYLWVATEKGLLQLDLNNKSVPPKQIPIGSIQPNSMTEGIDSFWLTSVNNEIIKLDKKTLAFQREYNIEKLINNNVVMSLRRRGDDMWLTTRNSLSRISLTDGRVKLHIPQEVLDENDINEGALLITSDEKVLIGGANGIWAISPKLFENKVKLLQSKKPVFTDLLIFNQSVPFNELSSRSTEPVFLTDKVSLQNSDSPFSLKFAQLDTVDPATVEYRYQMMGLSDQWLNADSKIRQATFTNLGFGSYQLRVQSREPGGPWSQTSEIDIHVAAPFWLNFYALVAYGIFIALLIIYWLRQFHIRRAAQQRLSESEERLKMSLWSSGDELWDWDIGKNEIIRANTWGTIAFPQDNQRAMIKTASNIHENDISRVQETLRAHLRQKSDYYEVTYRVKDEDGSWMWILDRGKVVSWNEKQPLRMSGTLKNINHLKQAEEQLHLFKRSIENISDGVFITGRDFKFISVNQSYCNITGETKAQALASYLSFHQYPESFTLQIKKALLQKRNWLGEIDSVRINGEQYQIELNIDAIFDEDNKISHFVGVFSDITARKETEKELLKLANSDTLTELPNRSFFLATMKNLVRKNIDHVLICMDMDNFKKINDSLGHQTGDKLIKHIAIRLQHLVGNNETCYRLGGDEFSILIENNTDMHKVTHLAQGILSEMMRPFNLNRQEFVLGCSVGIAFYPNDGETPQELLKNADTAMYFAKNAGGNKYQFFSGEMNQNAVRQLQIETLIRHGLKEDLFSVFYQPKVDVASGDLVSMEALVRFEHPDKGIISPSQFIPLAENTGQIIAIGERVLLKACTDTKHWVDQGMFAGRVAVNLSARQFELPDLDERIAAILRKTGLSPRYIELEITEGTLMQNPEQALGLMQRLRDMGIHLALDDFGTGYSSLAYLKKFPLNTLKIDKAFIDDIVTSETDRHMASAIITIAHNLGLSVVAEGVEDEKQLAILRRYQCEMIQGFLYSKPLNKERFHRLLSESHTMKKMIKHKV